MLHAARQPRSWLIFDVRQNMGVMTCNLTSDAKAALFEKLSASGKRICVRRTQHANGVEEHWLVGGRFSGAWCQLLWEEERKAWNVWFAGRGLWSSTVVGHLFDAVVAVVDSHPGCSSHLKKRA